MANNDPAACYPSAVLGPGATVITNRREIAADDFVGMYTTALDEGEIITAIRFPSRKRAAYMKFKQPASRFSLVGVFVAQFDAGVRGCDRGFELRVPPRSGAGGRAVGQLHTPGRRSGGD